MELGAFAFARLALAVLCNRSFIDMSLWTTRGPWDVFLRIEPVPLELLDPYCDVLRVSVGRRIMRHLVPRWPSA